MTSEVKAPGFKVAHDSLVLAPQSPGPMLRALRLARRLSQEELAHRAGVSTRHLSCLETGRARPSHQMLLTLGSALDLPLRDRNTLLGAAGFAPLYRASALNDPSMAHVHQAISHILRQHEPHPAVVLDRSWNVLLLNEGAARLFAWCGIQQSGSGPPNALRGLFDASAGLRNLLVNFEDIADAVLWRIRAEADADPQLRGLVDELEGLYGDTRVAARPMTAIPVALPIHIRHREVDLRYFTTFTTLGTPLDVTAQELRIESYFPVDAATEEFGRQLARNESTAIPL